MEKRINDLLAQMTLEEKITLCSGGSLMKTAPIDRLGIGNMEMTDGPQGVRSTGQPGSENTTAFPCGVALAATFDTAEAEKYGKAIALDCKALGISAILGPGINLMRTPLNGRNFEYFGEDPVLAGKIAAGYVKGCQQEKVAATPKHLALNNQEICRTTGSSDIDERTLRELYLTAFETVVKEAQPWLIMSSYNRINGTFAAENGMTQDLITKREWGFDGVMVSDWSGAHDTIGCALGGLDLEMPGPGMQFKPEKLLPLVRSGAIPESVIDDKVRRILRLLCRTGAIDGITAQGSCGDSKQLATAKECAENATVLLKNNNSLLPLDKKNIKKIIITGPEADFRHHRGTLRTRGGSGAVFSEREITPLAGLQNFAAQHGFEVEYLPTIRFSQDASCPEGFFGENGLKCTYYPSKEAMLSGKDMIFEKHNQSGIWDFNVASAQFAGNNVPKSEQLPESGFAVRISGKLNPPANTAGTIIFTPNGDNCMIRINGTVRWESKPGDMQWKLDVSPVCSNAMDIEIEFFTDVLQFASFNISWYSPEAEREKEEKLLNAAKCADAVIFCAGRTHFADKEALGWGNFYTADIPSLTMPGNQDELILRLAAVNPKTIVTLTGGGVMDVEKWIDSIPALLMLWYPGEAGGSVLSDILFGEVNPSGKLPLSWAKNLNDYPCHANGNYPGNREDADPRVRYDEGIFIGYRHFDRKKTDLRFPFGFGLSYSEFKVELLEVKQTGKNVYDAACEVTVKVTNISNVRGKEVIQLYTGANTPEFPRPVKELKAFAKVELAPQESKEVKFELNWRDFACFHPDKHHWCVPEGKYNIFLALDAGNIIDSRMVEFN